MGLLLSVFVVFIGVVELLSFYSNFRRSLEFPDNKTKNGDFSPLIRRYEAGLHRERRRILKIIDNYRKLEQETLEIKPSRSPSPCPTLIVPRNSVCQETLGNVREELTASYATTNGQIPNGGVHLESPTFDSVEFWPNKSLVERKKAKAKGSGGGKRKVKFGLSVEGIEPDWSRAPSPIFKLMDAKHEESSLQIVDLNRQQIVPSDYWRRSPSPFKEFIESDLSSPEESSWNADKRPASSDEDEERRYGSVCSDTIPSSSGFASEDAWNSEKKLSISSDEDREPSPFFDKDFMETLDGLKSKKRSFRQKQGRRTPKQVSLDADEENGQLQEAENDEREYRVTSTRIVKSFMDDEVDDDEEVSSKDRNSAANAFWLIFSGEYTKAMNKDWHGQHFCCWQCDESLTGQRYVLRDDHPYCVACYESVFANSCEKCSKTIGIDSKDLSYKDKHWHEACFLCATCGDSLVDKQFGSKGDRIYCGRCYDEQFASRCDGCGQIFRAGTKKMEYKTRQWHEKCFCCCVCKTPIGTQSFIPREQEIYCAKCYEEKYATRCIKCNKVITSGGVTYKNEPWHRECFTCTHCNTSLAGARFTSRDDKPYCAECFGELFAKRCTACNKPITGIGGTKFISFEDRHWHNDCFFCASCRTSLVGRGFITDGDDIICPECAKQKLM